MLLDDCKHGAVFLQPGEWYFGEGAVHVRTLLGSCVSITLWHESLRMGGMCHYMLPTRRGPDQLPDARYGDEAMALMLQEIGRVGTRPQQYQAKIFGGGNLFGKSNPPRPHVGMHNISFAKELVQKQGFRFMGEHLGGEGHRTIIFCLRSGYVWHRFTQMTERK
jgi:chemotaxis protein CheD